MPPRVSLPQPAPPEAIPSFTLTVKQVEANKMLGGPERYDLLVGGSRSGKTSLLTRATVIRALRFAGSRHGIFRFRTNAVRASVRLDTFPKVMRLCFPDVPVKYNDQDLYATLPNKSEVWFSGLDDKERVEKILGLEFATLFLNECSQIPFASQQMVLTRLAQKIDGLRQKAYHDLNPVGNAHWTAQLWLKHRLPGSLESLRDPQNYASMFMNPEDNRENLTEEYIDSLKAMPERLRRRFYEGEYISQVDGALWTLEGIEQDRVDPTEVPPMRRIVVAIDPSGAEGPNDFAADAIGIVTMGLGVDDHGYLFDDLTGLYSPEQWGRIARDTYRRRCADRIVGEKNFGGDMVRAVVHGADPNLPYRAVNASRGKVVRAEPIAAMAERHRIHHVGRFPLLEDELCNFTTAGYLGTGSPNRADAYVWAATELFGHDVVFGLKDFFKEEIEVEQQRQEDRFAEMAKVTTSTLTKPATTSNAACPQCSSKAISYRGKDNGYRCNQCGAQWGSASIQMPDTSRAAMLKALDNKL